MSERDPKWNYRLPTDAEWEFMARAGTVTPYSFGNDVGDLKYYAYFSKNSRRRTHPVASKRANPWGLYDIHGNVWQWMGNRSSESITGGENPTGPRNGSFSVIRGGSWMDSSRELRSASRGMERIDFRGSYIGFRAVRTMKVLH